MNRKIKTGLKIGTGLLLAMALAGGVWWYVVNTKTKSVTVDKGNFASEQITALAKDLARKAYVGPASDLSGSLKNLDYDQYRDIRFVRENGPWYGKSLPFEMQLFHLGFIFQNSVKINEIENGKVRRIQYSPAFFDYGKNKLNTEEFAKIGYAGFRLHYPLNTESYYDELISFLGASYFRALGQGQKYGLSARGLAINTALQIGEEFPIFKEFWIEKPKEGAAEIKLYALLDSPSITGAYSFIIQPGLSTTVDVNAVLFPRRDIEKLGVAPLTSMFLFGENNKYQFDDHRPEVHDSDGLLVWNGNDEWLWRPLDNSKHLRISSFVDDNPKGFGLMQRDRDPDHYQDFEAFYELRPSVWVEPLENWGKGIIQLVEIPSQQEIHDNIVAFFVPERKIKEGHEYQFSYRLHWAWQVPIQNGLFKVASTYTGVGGVSGMLENDKRKFVIDFVDGPLKNADELIKNGELTAEISASKGVIKGQHLMINPITKAPRVYLDFQPDRDVSELRVVLKYKGKVVSEVWSYQWLP